MAQKKRGKTKGEWEMEVDPQCVRFMHSKISPVFSDGKPVIQTLAEIESGALFPEDLPKITVIQGDQDTFFSLNNRRLWVLKQCRDKGLLRNNTILVRVKPLPSSKRLQNKFDTTRCSLTASFIKEKPKTENQGSETACKDKEEEIGEDSE